MTAAVEVLPGCTRQEAEEITRGIRQHVEAAWSLVIEAKRRRVWLALGYRSWDEYVRAEINPDRLALPKAERREAVRLLVAGGLTPMDAASVIGASRATAYRDAAEPDQSQPPVSDETPPQPAVNAQVSKPRKPPLPKQFHKTVAELDRLTRKLGKIVADERFPGHRDALPGCLLAEIRDRIDAALAALAGGGDG